MVKPNREARSHLHKTISAALDAGHLTDPMEEFAAQYMTYLFIDLIEDPCVDFVLSNVVYGDLTTSSAKEQRNSNTIPNDSEVELLHVWKFSETYKEEYGFSYKEGVKIGVSVEAEVNIPFIGGGKVTVTGELGFEAQRSVTLSNTRTFEVDEQIKVPPHSVVTATQLIKKALISGPFTAYYVPVMTRQGRKQWIDSIDRAKEFKGVSLEPLKYKTFVEIYHSLDLRQQCTGQLEGVQGHDVTVEVSQKKLETA